MVVGDNGIDDYKKCRQIDDDFDHHAARGIQRDVHCSMKQELSYILSYQM
jgi:hypothetical protein